MSSRVGPLSLEAKTTSTRTLRELLVEDVAARLGLDVKDVQLVFDQRAELTGGLSLAEPHYEFDIFPRRLRNLGSVSWDVTATPTSGEGPSRKLSLSAIAAAWAVQTVAARSIPARQAITEEDLVESRVLLDRLPDPPALERAQIVGQVAVFDVEKGSAFTARMVEAVILAKPNQLVTVTLRRGPFVIRTVGRSVDTGTLGQTIRVRNETTREVVAVKLTGPQQAVMDDEAPQGATLVADGSAGRVPAGEVSR